MTAPPIDGGEKGSTLELPKILDSPKDFNALRKQIRSIDGDRVGKVAVLGFRALQLYRIAKLQGRLIELQNAVMKDGENDSLNKDSKEEEEADRLIQRYADAIRNYETLSQVIKCSKGAKYDFLGTNEGFDVVQRGPTFKSKWRFSENEVTALNTNPSYDDIGPLGFRELDRKRRIERENLNAFKSRFHMALLGGVSLIAPLLIMTLHPGLVVDLVTTSIATVIFAIIITFFGTDASGKDVLALTAAYTAVLVVFVGASLGSGTTVGPTG